MSTPEQRQKPKRVTGIAHVFAAAGYSLGGLRRLWQETAFRHITLAAPVGLGLLVTAGAQFSEFAIFMVLFLLLIAVEALNTAIECIVDHLAPDWQVFAKDAKDLGSLATLCLLLANVVFIGAVVARGFLLA